MRSYRVLSRVMFVIAVAPLAACFENSTDDTSVIASNVQLSGAIFTSTVDGSRVNANVYPAKTDVYLDGGPGDNAPGQAAALPAGDYYFQVTDPSGQTLLSTDAIACRRIHINAAGVIDIVYPGPGCQHAQGVDSDHAALGAITVQLMPYLDTPNEGGEYKAWVTPVGEYDPGSGVHGFIHNQSKTDNFKIRIPGSPEPAICGDGILDPGEQCDDGNTVNDDGCASTCTIEPPPPPPCCGDGYLDPGEQCDDGNTTPGDGCSATCTIEYTPPHSSCGDEHVDYGEQCDDGNTNSGDGCSAECKVEDVPGGWTSTVCLNCTSPVSRY